MVDLYADQITDVCGGAREVASRQGQSRSRLVPRRAWAEGVRGWQAADTGRSRYRTGMRNAIAAACFVKLTGSAPAGSHLQGLRSPEGDAGMESDLLICCGPQSRAGRPRGKQGECRDEYLGCLAGTEPAGEGQPR
jgi:hypothetical protein